MELTVRDVRRASSASMGQVQYTAEIKEAREKAAKEPDDVMHWGSGFRVTSFRSEVSSSKSGMCSRASGGSSSRGAPSI